MSEKRENGLEVFSIMSLYFVMVAFNLVTPAMATFAQHFTGKDISWISTLPKLFIVIGTALAGSIMGKKVKYRTVAVLGSLTAVIFGCAPALFDSYTMTIICRAGFGFGMGLMAPLGNALIIGNYKNQKQAQLLGYGTLFMNGGGIIMQMLGGLLAGISWQLTFWGHAFVLIAFFMAFFIPEPEFAGKSEKAAEPKAKVEKPIFVIGFLLFLYNVVNYPILMNVSVLFEIRNAGGPTAAATALSLYTIAGVIAGLIFGTVFKVAKRWILAIGFLLAGIGALLVYIGSTGLIMTIGLMSIGFGFSCFYPACMAWSGKVAGPKGAAAATSVILALMNLGGFVSSFWLKLLNLAAGENLYSSLICAIACYMIIGIIFVVYSPFKMPEK